VLLFLERHSVIVNAITKTTSTQSYPAFTAVALVLAITTGAACCFIFPNVGQPHPLLNIPQEEKLTTSINKAAKSNNLFFSMIKRCR